MIFASAVVVVFSAGACKTPHHDARLHLSHHPHLSHPASNLSMCCCSNQTSSSRCRGGGLLNWLSGSGSGISGGGGATTALTAGSFPSALEAYDGDGARHSRLYETTVFDSMLVTIAGTVIASLTMELVDSSFTAMFGSSAGSRSVMRVLATMVIAFCIIGIVMYVTNNPFTTHRSDPGPLLLVAPTPAIPHVPQLSLPQK